MAAKDKFRTPRDRGFNVGGASPLPSLLRYQSAAIAADSPLISGGLGASFGDAAHWIATSVDDAIDAFEVAAAWIVDGPAIHIAAGLSALIPGVGVGIAAGLEAVAWAAKLVDEVAADPIVAQVVSGAKAVAKTADVVLKNIDVSAKEAEALLGELVGKANAGDLTALASLQLGKFSTDLTSFLAKNPDLANVSPANFAKDSRVPTSLRGVSAVLAWQARFPAPNDEIAKQAAKYIAGGFSPLNGLATGSAAFVWWTGLFSLYPGMPKSLPTTTPMKLGVPKVYTGPVTVTYETIRADMLAKSLAAKDAYIKLTGNSATSARFGTLLEQTFPALKNLSYPIDWTSAMYLRTERTDVSLNEAIPRILATWTGAEAIKRMMATLGEERPSNLIYWVSQKKQAPAPTSWLRDLFSSVEAMRLGIQFRSDMLVLPLTQQLGFLRKFAENPRTRDYFRNFVDGVYTTGSWFGSHAVPSDVTAKGIVYTNAYLIALAEKAMADTLSIESAFDSAVQTVAASQVSSLLANTDTPRKREGVKLRFGNATAISGNFTWVDSLGSDVVVSADGTADMGTWQ